MIKLFRTKYNDEQLAQRAERALSDDPIINLSRITISSVNGVLSLGGYVRNEATRQRAVETVQRAFEKQGLKYDHVEDEMELETSADARSG